jgi:hypothetical protein
VRQSLPRRTSNGCTARRDAHARSDGARTDCANSLWTESMPAFIGKVCDLSVSHLKV